MISRTEEDDCYMADIPSLHSCMAFGDTIEEAIANLHEALEGTLETMIENGISIHGNKDLKLGTYKAIQKSILKST